MKKTLILLSILVAGLSAPISAKDLNFKTDGDVVIDAANVDCLIAADDSRTFTVVLKDGGTVDGVHMLLPTEESAVRNLQAESEHILVVHDKITLTQLPTDAEVKIMSINGALLLVSKASNGVCEFNITGLQPGVYIVATPCSSLKFIKK